MKRKLFTLLSLAFLLSIFMTAGAKAFNARSGDTVTVAKSDVVDSTFYTAGKNITIAGTVKGDVFCAGQNVEISGTVEGDVLCAAQDLHISGVVQGDVRLAGQTVDLSGTVNGNATLMGQSLTVQSTAWIGHDATLAGQTARMDGKIGRDIVFTSSNTTIGGTVGRDVEAYGENSELKGGAQIGGNFVYTSNRQATINDGAIVMGKTERKVPAKHNESQKPVFVKRVMNPLFRLLMIIITGLALVFLVPRWFGRTGATMQKKWASSLGIGFVVTVVAPVIATLLMLTVVGIPLGVMLTVVWLFGLLASFVFGAFALGTWLWQYQPWFTQRGQEIAALIIGSIIILVLSYIPVVGVVVSVLVGLWGAGGFYASIMESIRAQHRSASAR